MARISRFFVILCSSWSLFLIWGTHQLQSSQTQLLLQVRKHLEYPKELENWVIPRADLCFQSSPQVNITCQDNIVSQVTIFGDSNQILSKNFSIDSLVVTLSRLNTLKSLSLVSLGMWGSLPDKIHRLQSLEYLDLRWNFLYGTIPQTLSRITTLRVLKIDGNSLNGTLPSSFPNLMSLSLSQNMLAGPLPSALTKLTSLTDINLSKNAISGDLPDLSNLSGLQWLDLSYNKLNSVLPSMPRGVTVILMRNNSLFGKIPDQYAELDYLQQLDLSSNALTSSIPARLTCGGKLQLVDISNNRLSGALPACLNSNPKNMVVRFGGNCLSADQRHQHPEAYCVGSIRVKKEAGGENSGHDNHLGLLIGIVCGVGLVVLGLGVGFFVVCRRYCPRGTSEHHLLSKSVNESSVTGFSSEILANASFIADAEKMEQQVFPAHRSFSLDELKAATNDFDKLALMGEGSTGKIYKGRLESGAQVAVRCLTVSRKYTIRNLKLRLDLLAKLRHPHLVCLLGHCMESDCKVGDNSVYLIYEYIPSGSYRAHLNETNSEKVLKWSDRLGILIGIAKAVHFLHTGIIPGFYSNRLKSSNILLNEHRIGKLSDYGLSVVAQEIHKDEVSINSLQMKSLDDDIYSFGLILLESLVGPSVLAKTESFMLNEMVSLSNPDGQMRVVDPNVLASCSRESLAIVVSLTINCISPESSNRPSFEDVLWSLQYAAQVQATWDRRPAKTHLSSP
ncbi:Leucine-rich repeat protein kinase family protein [Striga hermonthica]|uniref:Leucine-rich repeat protein kinase family protein n=1 Tax=Striga hermonthica TaxID=68872 RepID=A0A9N7MCI8_STRHE|nr:Leucine-rich repeat protein kinase family protein [Striga hermonthica]